MKLQKKCLFFCVIRYDISEKQENSRRFRAFFDAYDVTILLFVIFVVIFLNQMLKPQEPPRTDGDECRYDYGYKESEGGCLHAIDEIHTEKR